MSDNRRYSAAFCLMLLGAWTIACAVGCQRPSSQQAAAREGSEFKTLTLAYIQFVRDRRGKLPVDDQEFRKYVAKELAGFLAEKGLSADEAFVSPRDGQEYVFASQKDPPPANSDVVAYERLGVDGRRYVGDRSGTVQELDDAKFTELGLPFAP